MPRQKKIEAESGSVTNNTFLISTADFLQKHTGTLSASSNDTAFEIKIDEGHVLVLQSAWTLI